MDIKSISLDDLEMSPEAYEWAVGTGAKTVGDLIAKFPDPNDESQPEPEGDSLHIGDNICHSIGYYLWLKLSEGN